MDPLVFAAKLMGRAFGFIGLLVMAWGALSLAASIHAWLRCGRTQGEVIDFIEKPGHDNTRAYYAPVVRFTHGQQVLTFESCYALPNPRYAVGTCVRVAFKPEAPTKPKSWTPPSSSCPARSNSALAGCSGRWPLLGELESV